MDILQEDIKRCKSQGELYDLLKGVPKVYHTIFRRGILSKFGEFGIKP